MVLRGRSRLALLLALALPGCDSSPPGQPPVAFLKAPGSCDLGGTMVLDASASSDPDGDIILFRFVVADGSPSREETQPRINHLCRVAGLIEAGVEVVDSTGQSAWARAVVSVRRR